MLSGNMGIIFIILFLCFIFDACASTLWKDNVDAEHDSATLQNGENLIYLSSGSAQFNMNSVSTIVNELKITSENTYCISLSDVVKPNVIYDKISRTSTMRTLFVLYDLQVVEGEFNRKSLDFIFRLSDSSREYSNVVVLLLYDSHSSSVSLNGDNWKQMLAERLNSESQFVNGHALVGRVNRAAIEDSASVIDSASTQSLIDYCTQVNSRQLSAAVLKAKESASSRLQFNWLSALVILLPVGAFYAYRSQQPDPKLSSQNNLPIIRPTDKKEDNFLKDIKIIASASTASLPSVETSNETPVATPPTAKFDSNLFRSDYHNNGEGRTGSSYYGEGSVNSADKAAAVAQLLMSEETISITSSGNSKHSYNGKRSNGSGSKRTNAIFNIANRLSFGESSSVSGSVRSPSDEVTAVTNAHNALFSLPITRITTVQEDSPEMTSDASPAPIRDISKIHVTIDESIAPVKIRGRRKTSPATLQDSPGNRRQTRSQDMTTRSGAILNGISGSGVRRSRAKSDQSRDGKKLPPFTADV